MNSSLPWFLNKDSQFIYNSGRYVVFDFETTNLDKGSALNKLNRIVLACWYVVEPDGRYVVKHCFGDEYEQQELVSDCLSADFLVAHNAKFDLQWLARCGVDLTKVLPADTMLAQWVLDGNQGTLVTRSLDNLATSYSLSTNKNSLVSSLISQGVCPSEIRKDWLLKYCLVDVDLTHQLFRKQLPELNNKNLLHIFHTRNLTCACLADIETAGMTLDKELVHQEYHAAVAAKLKAEQTLNTLTGGINLNSPKQVATYLYDTLGFKEIKFRGEAKKTKSGNRATDSATISQLKITNDKQRLFIEAYKEYNKLDSLLSKNLVFFEKVCNERDGTFYGLFNQGVTGTHRLSSSGRPLLFDGEKKTKSVQFQNMPRQYKGLFWSGNDDYLIGECDGAQLEFRVAADLGNDGTAYQEIVDKVDVHSITAQTLTAAGQPTTRQQAKASTFAPLYGGMGKTKAEQEYCEFFKQKYEGISSTQFGWSMMVGMSKTLVTPYGMRYYWPDARMVNGRLNKATEVYNYPVAYSGFAQ